MIYLAGKNNIAVHALEYLLENHNGNVTVLTNKTDNGADSWQRSLKKRSLELGVKQTEIGKIKVSDEDILISLEFDQLIKPEIFLNCNAYNIHFSKLPKYKGMYTSVFPILYNELESGVTLHDIDKGIDTGDIYLQKCFAIKTSDRAADLYHKYIRNSIELFNESIEFILKGTLKSKKQSSENSTYFSKDSIDFKNIFINLNDTAWNIKKAIYAFSFRHYQLPKIHGKTVVEAEILDEKSKLRPGTIIRESEKWMIIATIDYDLCIYFDCLKDILPLMKNCHVNQVENYIKNICGINDRNDKGWSPIIVASYHGNLPLVEKLIKMGANVNDTNYKGTSVLMYAKDFCLNSKDKILFDYLISNGADINQKDFKGKMLVDYLSESEINFLNL